MLSCRAPGAGHSHVKNLLVRTLLNPANRDDRLEVAEDELRTDDTPRAGIDLRFVGSIHFL